MHCKIKVKKQHTQIMKKKFLFFIVTFGVFMASCSVKSPESDNKYVFIEKPTQTYLPNDYAVAGEEQTSRWFYNYVYNPAIYARDHNDDTPPIRPFLPNKK